MTLLQHILPSFTSRFVLMLGDEGAVLVYLEDGVVIRRLFAPSSQAEHVNSMLELFRAHPTAPIYLLVDMMDQSYVRHALPPVTQLGLGKLVQRRLDRDFSKDDIKGALNLGREAEGRKDWNFLLIALSNSETLKAWIKLVADLPNHFAGIYLAPVECEEIIYSLNAAFSRSNNKIFTEARPPQSLEEASQAMQAADKEAAEGGRAKKLPFSNLSFGGRKSKAKGKEQKERDEGSASQWQMLISHNKIGGFRQVVLRNGKLVFTRLTQAMNESQPEVLAGNIEQEVLNTIEYLKRLAYNPKTGLDIYLIVAQEIKNSISSLRFGATNVHVLTPFEASEALRLKQAVLSGDRFGDVVLATAFGVAKKRRLKLNSDYTRRVNALESMHLAMRAASAALAVGLLAYSVYSLVSLQAVYSANSDIQDDLKKKKTKLTELTEAASALPEDVDEVVDMMFLSEVMSENNYNVLQLVNDLSGLIDANSLVLSMSWRASNLVNPSREKKNGQKVTVSLELELIYQEENWEAFLEKFNNLIARFRQTFPAYEVTSSTLPGSFESTDSLKINFEDMEEQRAGPPLGQTFTVTIGITGPLETPASAKPPRQQHGLLTLPASESDGAGAVPEGRPS